MYKTIQIADKEVEMLANGISAFVYWDVFHEDFILQSQKPEVSPHIFEKLGFVFAKQAEIGGDWEKLTKLSQKDFYEWMSQFEPMDVLNASDEIMQLYVQQSGGGSKPKK